MKIKIDCDKHDGHEEEADAVLLVSLSERQWVTRQFGELPPAVIILKHGDHFDTLRANVDDGEEVLEPFMQQLLQEAWRKMDGHHDGDAS